ncbi:sugar phosphate nucleotidyltransferase [Metabacillus iocasae]|uniref:Glucose-1-phosphate adenylyltransferase n=1 Tax=Priestia iocasae TaxID=2291674 RepID=A0ABS2QZ90_9BACI|nr:sugar phosphate nucleotidyltransferase [Metabacillus iocasae]MBM7704804.1 glucose-1-phosphate adenylyltransferase [Metabacillus iocasae]
MNTQMLGIIDACTNTKSLQPLTSYRSIAALPFAGRYRLIDFALSNMVHSGIHSVALFPRYHYRSLMDHLGSGKEWDLNRKRDGLFIFPPMIENNLFEAPSVFSQLRYHINYFLRSTQKYAVIANSYTVCNINFQQVLARHIDTGATITEVVQNGESLHMYIIETETLVDMLQNSTYDFATIEDFVAYMAQCSKVLPYEHVGYVATISSTQSYFEASMDILSSQTWKQLFMKERPVYTKVKDEPPTRYATGATVKNSVIANGCIIEGHVENSIIFRGVRIEKGVVIKNSIVMQKGIVKTNSLLNSAILDKDVKVGPGFKLIGDTNMPHVIAKGSIQGALMKS